MWSPQRQRQLIVVSLNLAPSRQPRRREAFNDWVRGRRVASEKSAINKWRPVLPSRQ